MCIYKLKAFTIGVALVFVNSVGANRGAMMFGKSKINLGNIAQKDLEINGVTFHNSSKDKEAILFTMESIKTRKDGKIYSTPVILVWPAKTSSFKSVRVNQLRFKEAEENEAFKVFFSQNSSKEKEADISVEIKGSLSESVFPIVKRVISGSLFGKGAEDKNLYAIFITEKSDK